MGYTRVEIPEYVSGFPPEKYSESRVPCGSVCAPKCVGGLAMPGDDSFQSEDLLPLARAGDGEALGRLLGSCRSYLKLLAQVQIDRRLSGKADASDVVQDTLLYAHQVFRSFRGTTEAELLGWLRRVLASKLKNLVRRYCECAVAQCTPRAAFGGGIEPQFVRRTRSGGPRQYAQSRGDAPRRSHPGR